MRSQRILSASLAALLVGGASLAGSFAGTPAARAAGAAALAATTTAVTTPAATTTDTATTTALPSATASSSATATSLPTTTATASPSTMVSPSATATVSPTATTALATTVAPTASPTSVTAALSPTTTATTVAATLVVTPTATNRGGLVTVSGTGFQPHETVAITLSSPLPVTATATADASGALPPTGLSIPYSTPLGAYTVTARGVASGSTATATLTVQHLTPRITLSPTTVSPGSIVTVTGSGFGRQEQVTLALNGAALSTTAPITTSNGAFTATFSVPGSLLRGYNTVSAIGNSSRVSAITALYGQLPVAAQFYFAGGENTASTRSFINVLNPNAQSGHVTLRFYFQNGATADRSFNVAPHAQRTVAVAGLVSTTGAFGLRLLADRAVTAQLNLTRGGRDGDALLGNTGLGERWYLAEGYTGLTFHETVSILNPATVDTANVQLQLLPLGSGAGRTVQVSVPPHTNAVVDINRLLPGRSVSIIASSSAPVVVERTLTFSTNGYGLTTRAGTNVAATSWLFAEGTTVNHFETYLTILNPNAAPAVVTASFFGAAGNALGSRTIVVAGQRRANIKLNDFLNASAIASVVTSNAPIVVERPEYFGSPNGRDIPGSDVFGRNGAGIRWSFPGGNTAGNREFLLLYNPSTAAVVVDATFYGTNGTTTTRRFSVAPTQRLNIDVNREFPGITPIHGAVVQAVGNTLGFVAEQTVFAPDYSQLRSTEGLAQ